MATKHLLPIITSLLIGGCGDDGGTVTPPGDDDMPCGGHGQPECTGPDAEFLQHTGGEVRLEYVETQTGALQIILYAWFVSAQTPETVPYTSDGCTNILSYTNNTNAGMAVNDTRTYMDVGETVTLSYQGQDIVLHKYTNIADKRGLVMDIGYAVDGNVRGTVSPTMILPGAEYAITLGNGTVFPAKIKVPTSWQTVSGNMAFGGGATNNLLAADGVNWKYTFVDEPYTKAAMLLFGGNNAQGVKESWFCIGNNTGQKTLTPAEVATFPKSGTVQGATIAHQKVNFNNRTVDVIGITCRQNPFVIQ